MRIHNQDRKYSLGLAGEFLVAGELLRRGIRAAVTYGNAKKADVVAFREGRATQLEVKSTSEGKWVLGSVPPPETGEIWVLVHLPTDLSESPEYFILSSEELRKLVLPRHEAYAARYLEKHGTEFSGKGVVSVDRGALPPHCRGAWHKVTGTLGA